MATNNSTSTDLNSEWNISTDVYDIARSVNALKKRYIDDVDETTLSLGIYGFFSDVLTKEIQTDTIMTGILGNEMFPNRAQLTKNVLAHAIYNSITDINAVPATITVNIGLKVSDFNKYAVDNKFIFDHMCSFFIDKYEFHFDYDVILTRSSTKDNVFSAHYDMTTKNRTSKVTQPYLNQPFIIRINDFDMIVFQAKMQQVTITEYNDSIISNSVIDNRTYTFTFPNQLVDFDVYVEDKGETTRLTPLLNGNLTSDTDGFYCWYLYMSDNSIRISFDPKSYVPGLNSKIYIKAYSTLGKSGDFTYARLDQYSEGFYVDISSEYLGYKNLNCFLIADSDSIGGQDSKKKEDLQRLIPKAAVARGSITTEKDIENYFNLIDNEDNRLVLRKKVDNNISRVWYCYMLLKDAAGDIIPTNSIKLKLDKSSDYFIICDDKRVILPAGAVIRYDTKNKIGEVIDEAEVPELYSEDYYNENYYYYMNAYNIILNPDPLYCAFYMTIINQSSYYIFQWVNEDCALQFVANKLTFKRNLLTDQSIYKLDFKIAQSISEDFGLYSEDIVVSTNENGATYEEVVITNNMKCILVFYKNDTVYRWAECELVKFDKTNYISSWHLDLKTDNVLDDENNIKILDLHLPGKLYGMSYGFFGEGVEAKLYTLAKFADGSYGRYDLDDIAPGLDEYTVTNIYKVNNDLKLFENYTGITNTRTKVDKTDSNLFNVSNVPVVGLHYMTDEEKSTYFTDAIDVKKQYIEYCLQLVENNMDIDYKFFNTYGPSLTYCKGLKDQSSIGDVALCMRFRISLINASDIYTKDDVIQAIKKYMEDLYTIGSWHAPNMISTLMNENQFNTRCNFIEFLTYNNNDMLGIQHIIQKDISDPHVVPEFLNIRNVMDLDGNLVPDIEVDVVDN